MRLFGNSTAELTKEDIERLMDNQVPESIVLDYKAEPPKRNDAGKKELLADISAMANTSGGLLIFRMKEAQEGGKNAGYPMEVSGMKDRQGNPINIEQFKQYQDNVIRDGLDARLTGIEYKEIQYDEDKLVFVIEVPRSLQPHTWLNFKRIQNFTLELIPVNTRWMSDKSKNQC